MRYLFSIQLEIELAVGCRNLELRVVVLVGALSLNIVSIDGI